MRKEKPLLAIWEGMIGRCTNPNNKDFPRYGGRGISVCPEWIASYEAFESYMLPRPSGASIDRIDNDGNYEPGNVQWATVTEQARNRRSNKIIHFKGHSKTVAEWAEILGLNPITLSGRLRRMNVEDALNAPPNPRHEVTFRGETKTLSEWAREKGMQRKALHARIFINGWSVERALTTPPRRKKALPPPLD